MSTTKHTPGLEAASVKATETGSDRPGGTRAYHAPELHVVGKAGELVQGNFGYTDRDLRYYWK
jgi:hypothetical protein